MHMHYHHHPSIKDQASISDSIRLSPLAHPVYNGIGIVVYNKECSPSGVHLQSWESIKEENKLDLLLAAES